MGIGNSSGVILPKDLLARPQQQAYGDPLPDIAASPASGLSRNHPFIDGDKRTAAVACETFIMLNGAMLKADDPELYPQYPALAEDTLDETEFASWLREHLHRDATDQAQETSARYADK